MDVPICRGKFSCCGTPYRVSTTLAHAAFADLGGDGVGAERGPRFKSHQLVGTRRSSSSTQFWTTMISGEAEVALPRVIIKNRPSGPRTQFLLPEK